MAKFLPTTTQTPMQVGNTGDSYDKMLEIVGGLIKQRKQAKDDEYTAKQREFQLGQQQRTLQEQEAEDIQKMNQQNIANLINTSSPLKFTKEQIAQEMASGNLTKQQAEIMLPKATDYISESDAMNTVFDALSLKPSMTDQEVISTAAEVGIEPRVALSLKDRVNQQILDKPNKHVKPA